MPQLCTSCAPIVPQALFIGPNLNQGGSQCYLGHSLGTPWALLGHALGTPWALLGHSLGTPWALLGHALRLGHSTHTSTHPHIRTSAHPHIHTSAQTHIHTSAQPELPHRKFIQNGETLLHMLTCQQQYISGFKGPVDRRRRQAATGDRSVCMYTSTIYSVPGLFSNSNLQKLKAG